MRLVVVRLVSGIHYLKVYFKNKRMREREADLDGLG